MTQRQWGIAKMFMLLVLNGLDIIMIKIGAFDFEWHKHKTDWAKDAFEGDDE